MNTRNMIYVVLGALVGELGVFTAPADHLVVEPLRLKKKLFARRDHSVREDPPKAVYLADPASIVTDFILTEK
jgi:hypothetical protein